jgi:hypothetical protein
MSYPNPWRFDGTVFDSEDIGKFVGFVYMIVSKVDGKKYIGKKYFYSIRKVKGKTRRQRTESDWKKYYGSSENLLTEIEKYSIINFDRVIISLHTTRGDCNYEEVKQQFIYNVLEEDGWFNENISGKYHRKPNHIIEGRRVSKVRL